MQRLCFTALQMCVTRLLPKVQSPPLYNRVCYCWKPLLHAALPKLMPPIHYNAHATLPPRSCLTCCFAASCATRLPASCARSASPVQCRMTVSRSGVPSLELQCKSAFSFMWMCFPCRDSVGAADRYPDHVNFPYARHSCHQVSNAYRLPASSTLAT